MKELEEFYFLLWAELDTLDFYDLTLVFPQSHIDDATSGIQETNYCFGEVEFDGFVL